MKCKLKKTNKHKVILLEKVRGLGHRGQVVDVAFGYSRNYLFPQNFAISYSENNLIKINNTLSSNFIEKAKQEAEKIHKILNNQNLCFAIQATSLGVLFGSVSKKSIFDKIIEKYNITIDMKKIILFNAIKTIGLYKIEIDLYDSVVAVMNLAVHTSIINAEMLLVDEKKKILNEEKK